MRYKMPGKKTQITPAVKKEFKHSVKAAELEFREEPMDGNYENTLIGIPSRKRVEKIISEMGDIKGKKILDVGCEAGFVSLEFKKRGAEVYGFDICEEPLHRFAAKKGAKGTKIFGAAAQKMPLPENFFDFVVCTEVFEHMPFRELGLEEMRRVLKKNGKVFITFPNEGLRKPLYPIAKLFGINTHVEDEVTLFEYNFDDMVKLVSKSFKIEKRYSWPFFYPITRFIVGKKR